MTFALLILLLLLRQRSLRWFHAPTSARDTRQVRQLEVVRIVLYLCPGLSPCLLPLNHGVPLGRVCDIRHLILHVNRYLSSISCLGLYLG